MHFNLRLSRPSIPFVFDLHVPLRREDTANKTDYLALQFCVALSDRDLGNIVR